MMAGLMTGIAANHSLVRAGLPLYFMFSMRTARVSRNYYFSLFYWCQAQSSSAMCRGLILLKPPAQPLVLRCALVSSC